MSAQEQLTSDDCDVYDEIDEAPCCCDSCGADVDDDAWECWWCGAEIL